MKPYRGFSLIELMIALTVGLIVTAALAYVFLGSRAAQQTTAGSTAIADDGRFAVEFLTRALRSAGYLQCTSAAYGGAQTVFPAGSSVIFDFTTALSGFEANGSNPGQSFTVASSPVSGDTSVADWTPSLPSLPNSPNVAFGSSAGPIQGNDVLLVHGTAEQSPILTTAPTTGGSIAVAGLTATRLDGTTTTLSANSLAVISDCGKSVAFQLASASGTTLTMSSGGAVTPSNQSASFTPVGFTSALGFTSGAMINTPTSSMFFIAPGRDRDAALFRGDLYCPAGGSGGCTGAYTLNSYELVPDVESMQILYGILSNGQIVNYETADLVASASAWNQVGVVRVALLVASPPNTVPPVTQSFSLAGTTVNTPADGRRRQVFEVTITLRDALP